jgi:hypothetical protein
MNGYEDGQRDAHIQEIFTRLDRIEVKIDKLSLWKSKIIGFTTGIYISLTVVGHFIAKKLGF